MKLSLRHSLDILSSTIMLDMYACNRKKALLAPSMCNMHRRAHLRNHVSVLCTIRSKNRPASLFLLKVIIQVHVIILDIYHGTLSSSYLNGFIIYLMLGCFHFSKLITFELPFSKEIEKLPLPICPLFYFCKSDHPKVTRYDSIWFLYDASF